MPPSADDVAERGKQRLELLELAVHGDAQGLERPRGGVDAANPRGAHRAHDGAPQVERRAQLAVGEGLLDAARDATRAALVAVLVDDVGQLVVGQARR